MKKITSIFLCILLMTNLCAFSAAAEETVQNLFTAANVKTFAFSHGDTNSNSIVDSDEMIQNLSASGDNLYAVFGTTISNTYNADAFFAVELDNVYNLTGVEVVYKDSDKAVIHGYRVFATESKAFFDEVANTPSRHGLSEKGKKEYIHHATTETETIYSAGSAGFGCYSLANAKLIVPGLIDKLIANGDFVASGNGESAVGRLNVNFDIPKNAKYLIFAIDKNVDTASRLKFSVDQIKIFGKTAVADTEACDMYKHYTSNALTVCGSKDKSSDSLTGLLNNNDTNTNDVIMLTTTFSSETKRPSNIWYAIDLGAEKEVSQINIYEQIRNIKRYRIYLTSNENLWSEVKTTGQNTRMGLSEKGKVQRLSRSTKNDAWPTEVEGTEINKDNVKLTVDGTLDKLKAEGALVGGGDMSLFNTTDGVEGYQTYYLDRNSKGRYLIFVIDELGNKTAFDRLRYFDIMGHDDSAVTELNGSAVPETISRPEENKVTVTAKLLNLELTAKKNSFIVAQYKGDQMVAVNLFDRDLIAMTGKELNESVSLDDEATKIKLFVWDKATLTPLNSFEEVLIENE